MSEERSETSPNDSELLTIRHSEFSDRWITLGTVLLLPLTIAFLSVDGGKVLMPLLLLLSVTMLLAHSITVTVGEDELEVRMGNGMIRQSIPLADMRSIHCEVGQKTWGIGLRQGSTKRFGTGAASTLRLEHARGMTEIGLKDPQPLMNVLRTRMSGAEEQA